MLELYSLATVTNLLVLLGIFPVGILGSRFFRARFGNAWPSHGMDGVVASLFLGLVWTAVWFYGFACTPAQSGAVEILVRIKLAIDLLALAVLGVQTWSASRRSGGARPFFPRGAEALRAGWIDGIGVLYAVVFGLTGIAIRPLATDNAALYWLARNVVGGDFALVGSQGSPFYLSALLPPAVLLSPQYVVGNIAAALKVVGPLLLWFMIRFLVERCFGRERRVLALPMFCFVLSAFFGLYGIVETTKETPLGIAFLIGFFGQVARCFDGEKPDLPGDFALLGMLASLAVGFAAVTVPYFAVILGLLVLTGRDGVRALFWCLVCGIPTMPFSLASMLHMPFAMANGLYLSACVVAWLLLRGSDRLWSVSPTETARWRSGFCYALLGFGILILLGLGWILPLRYAPIPNPPLDGHTSLFNLAVNLPFMNLLGPLIGWPGLLAVLCVAMVRKRIALLIFVFFPWIVLGIVCAIASLQVDALPFPPQHLWDLAKDIPNWWMAIYLSMGFAMAFEVGFCVLRRIASGLPVAGVLLLAGYYTVQSALGFRGANRVLYATGCAFHEDREMVRVLDLMHRIAYPEAGSGPDFERRWIRVVSRPEPVWSHPERDNTQALYAGGMVPIRFEHDLEWLKPYTDGRRMGVCILDAEAAGAIAVSTRLDRVCVLNASASVYLVGNDDSLGTRAAALAEALGSRRRIRGQPEEPGTGSEGRTGDFLHVGANR